MDSLLSLESKLPNQLALRVGYNSNVLSAGRTLGIENFGLSTGASFYHRSGLFADVTGFYSRDFTPNYYLTTLSAGFMKDISKKLSFISTYDRYQYHFDNTLPLRNALTASTLFEHRWLALNITYAFYFGDRFAHRILPGISFIIEKRKMLSLDRINIMPSFNALFGNEPVTTLEYTQPTTIREALNNIRLYGSRFGVVEKTRDVFGWMNYAFTVPVSMRKDRWTLNVSYTYNIPKALEGEVIIIPESTFLAGSLLYLIDFQPKKKAL